MTLKNNLLTALILVIIFGHSLLYAQQSAYKISGDSSYWDIPNNQMKYTGNAVFTSDRLTISGNQVIAQESAKGKSETIRVSGRPAQFNEKASSNSQSINLTAFEIYYDVASKTIIASEQVHLRQSTNRQETIEIFGDQLNLDQADDYQLAVLGSPLQITIKQDNEEPIKATASQLKFNNKSEQFELLGSVILTNPRGTMTAEKILYDMKTGILQVPKTPNRQVEIIQNKKSQ